MSCKQHGEFLQKTLRENKLKVTPGRLALLDVFEHAKEPLSVQDVLSKLPRADKVTLYRTVESLEKLGLLKQIRFHNREALYELTSLKHHHHLVCKSCGKVSDVSHCKISVPSSDLLHGTGFAKVTDHSLEFFGICNSCEK